jgi:cytochrome c biogenesis protein CcmG/thiol:disulfide interchange protein DsbE
LIVAAIASALIAVVLVSGTSNRSGTGRPAPALPTRVLVPPQVTLASLRGEPAAVNFWASWCAPCKQEAPDLERASGLLRGRARLVGVNWTDGTSAARSYVDRYHLTFPNLIDSDGVVGNNYGLIGLPMTFILDSKGKISGVLRGPQTTESLLRALHLTPDQPDS